LSPEIELEYKRLIERAEAYFSARVRWSGDGRIVTEGLDPVLVVETSEARWLCDLYSIRTREAIERPRAMHA
jgi:hypothetical protein